MLKKLAVHDGHAIVVGASMAGLLAARVLTDHFERVTLVERDQLPDTPTPRKGVPQARHAHILLVRGRRILDQLFPGLMDDLVGDGAVLFDSALDTKLMLPTGWAPRVSTGLFTVSCSRDLLEWRVRRRLLEHPRVTFLQETDALGLLARDKTIAGVRIKKRDSSHVAEELEGTLVVDASGRGSHGSEWLTALGYAAPPMTTINPFLGYATRIFAPPPDYAPDWKVLLIQTRPPRLARAGAILPIEGKRWIVTLSGYGRDFPPTDEPGFLAFASSLADPTLYRAIRDARPLSSITGYQRTANQMRHYERVQPWLENLFVLGDSVAAFNPVYGQGMTNAAMSAMALDHALCAPQTGAAGRFQKHLARQNATPWLLATNEDLRFPTTEGSMPKFATRLIQWYVSRVVETMVHEPNVYRAFSEVGHLLNPPGSLFHPQILARVIRHGILNN